MEPTFLIGKNAEDNWNIYRKSSQTDVLFHLDKFSSPYVIVNVSIDEITKELIMKAAQLCKGKSKYNNVPNIGVFYTSISNTKLGDKVGSLTLKSKSRRKMVNV
jgi:predicted ribosome quality control (RQC) complex YloA/Tae2 family protein